MAIVLGNNRILIEDAYLPSEKVCGLLDHEGNMIVPFEYRDLDHSFQMVY